MPMPSGRSGSKDHTPLDFTDGRLWFARSSAPRHLQSTWSIDFRLAGEGTPPGFRDAGDGRIDAERWEPAVAGRLYETVMDERPMFLMWQAWEPIPR